MSTYYRPARLGIGPRRVDGHAMELAPIPLKTIKRLCSITKVVDVIPPDGTHPDTECLHDGKNYLHFATDADGNVIDIFRYGGNRPDIMLAELEQKFGVRMVSEYEDEYRDLAHEETGVITLNIKQVGGKK